MTIVVTTAISTDYVNWDRLNRDFVASNELSRAFLASFILVMDLMIVMQVITIISSINNVLRLNWSTMKRNILISSILYMQLRTTHTCTREFVYYFPSKSV